jgi:hypothetical protein
VSTLTPVIGEAMRTLLDREVSEFAILMDELGDDAECEAKHDSTTVPCSIAVVALMVCKCTPMEGRVCQNTIDAHNAHLNHRCAWCKKSRAGDCWTIRPI